MHLVDIVLRLSGLVVFLAIILISIRRKLYSQLPFFSTYITFAPAATLLRLFLRNEVTLYFWLYWTTEAAYAVLALSALNEVFRRLYELEYKDHRWFKFLIPATTVILLSIALWGAVYHPLLHGRVLFVVRCIFWFDLGVHWLEAGILLLLVVLTVYFALPRSRYDFGILTGFAVSACVTLVTDLARSQLGPRYESWFQYGPPIGYLLAAIIWLYAFWRPPAPPPGKPDMRNLSAFDEFLDFQDGVVRKIARVLRLPGMHRHISRI